MKKSTSAEIQQKPFFGYFDEIRGFPVHIRVFDPVVPA